MKQALTNELERFEKLYSSLNAHQAHDLLVSTRRYADFSTSGRFSQWLGPVDGKLVYSLGGGIDAIAVDCAIKGASVVSVDLSPAACKGTLELARESGVEERISAVPGNCEEASWDQQADIVLVYKALHHMDIPRVLGKISNLLKEGGVFLAVEPVCLWTVLKWIHRLIPFHPIYEVGENEIELSSEHLQLFEQKFGEVDFFFFDFLTRASVWYFVEKMNIANLGNILKGTELKALQYVPQLRGLCSQVLIRARK
jgi:SAM-dependent methyltransferase